MDTQNDVPKQQEGVEWPQYLCHVLLEKAEVTLQKKDRSYYYVSTCISAKEVLRIYEVQNISLFERPCEMMKDGASYFVIPSPILEMGQVMTS